MNSTNEDCPINVPGLWHNGDCSLLCRPAKWYDILIFFFGNYLAHVATVVSRPGASVFDQILNLISALVFPFSGFGLGLEAIVSWAIFAPTSLETAARAGALLRVVQTEEAREAVLEDSNTQAIDSEVAQSEGPKECAGPHQNTIPALREHTYRPWIDSKIHGGCSLPDGYEFRLVSYYAKFKNDKKEIRSTRRSKNASSRWYDILFTFSKWDKTPNDVPCSYNGAKAIASIVQIAFGIRTLYTTKGNQVERFGYAAYGLTVTQYALMSFVNLAGNLLRPDYTSVYIVESDELDDLRLKHGCTIATIGQIEEDSEQLERHERRRMIVDLFQYLSCYIGIGIDLLVVGLMTKFSKGQSTLAQRVWTMCWLVFGALYGTVINMARKNRFKTSRDKPNAISGMLNISSDILNEVFEEAYGLDIDWYTIFAIFSVGAPTVGGFVVVAQMIKQYGVCSRMLDADG
ncbi:unnamed protein product [Alternaria alternata]